MEFKEDTIDIAGPNEGLDDWEVGILNRIYAYCIEIRKKTEHMVTGASSAVASGVAGLGSLSFDEMLAAVFGVVSVGSAIYSLAMQQRLAALQCGLKGIEEHHPDLRHAYDKIQSKLAESQSEQ